MIMLPSNIELASVSDLKELGEYHSFLFEKSVKSDITDVYVFVGRGRLRLFWRVKPIGGIHRTDLDVDSFYIIGKEGPIGLLFRTRKDPTKYRIVCFPKPLKRLPRMSKKFRSKKMIRRRKK
jgi:hypothetical protein